MQVHTAYSEAIECYLTYKYARRVKRPREEGIAPFSVLLDKSLYTSKHTSTIKTSHRIDRDFNLKRNMHRSYNIVNIERFPIVAGTPP